MQTLRREDYGVCEFWRNRLIPPVPEELEKLQRFIEKQKGNMGIPESYLKFACYAAEGDGGLLSDVLKGEFYTIKLPEITHNMQNGELLDIELLWDEMGVEYIIDLKNDGKISYGRSYYISSEIGLSRDMCSDCQNYFAAKELSGIMCKG